MSLIFEIGEIPELDDLVVDQCETKSHFTIDPSEAILTDDLRIEGKLARVKEDVSFSGSLSTKMQLICSRCLEPFEHQLKSEVSSYYVPRSTSKAEEGQELEIHASDVDIEFYSDDKIDLTQSIYDQIMLSLPIIRLCKEDCLGICSQCGVNLNIKTCNCEEEGDVDPRFAILKSIKDKLK